MKSRRELAYLQKYTGGTTTCGQSRQETCLQCEKEQREKKGLLNRKHERRGMTCCWELNTDITICKAVNIQPPPQWTLWSCKSRYSTSTDVTIHQELQFLKRKICASISVEEVLLLWEILYTCVLVYLQLWSYERSEMAENLLNYNSWSGLEKFVDLLVQQFGNILADIKSSGPQNALPCRQIDWKQWCVIKNNLLN